MDEKIQMLKKHWSKGGREEIKGGKCVSRLLPTWFCTPSYPSQKIPKNCRSSGLPHEHTRHVENARRVCVGCWEWGTQSLGLICIDLFSLKLPNVGYEFPNAMNKSCLKRAFFFLQICTGCCSECIMPLHLVWFSNVYLIKFVHSQVLLKMGLQTNDFKNQFWVILMVFLIYMCSYL